MYACIACSIATAALLWQKLPRHASKHSILFVEANWDYETVLNNSNYAGQATVCTIDAYWSPSAITYNMSTQSIGFQSDENKKIEDVGDLISIAPDLAEKALNIWLEIAPAETRTKQIYEADILIYIILIGISESAWIPKSWTTVPQSWADIRGRQYYLPDYFHGEQYNSMSRYISDNGLDKQYDEIYFFFTDENWTEARNLTQLVVQNSVHGYGYDSSEIPVRLSLGVIATYCLIVVIYIVTTLITGRTAISWDSISELVMLAMHSQPPAHLENTSVGVDTLATFREPVSIRVNENDVVELVFDKDTNVKKRRLREVVPNKAY